MLNRIAVIVGVSGSAALGYYAIYKSNHVLIPEESCGVVQNVLNYKIHPEPLPPGEYTLPIWDYVMVHHTGPKEFYDTQHIATKDNQIIRVTTRVFNHIDRDDMIQLERQFGISRIQKRASEKACKKIIPAILREYNMIEWLEQQDEILIRAQTALQDRLKNYHIHCDDIQIQYDLNRISLILREYYSEEELNKFNFYQQLKSALVKE